ncbi:MAG: hypothetical protein ACLR8Y_17470 [Alistipes indistinctus]
MGSTLYIDAVQVICE